MLKVLINIKAFRLSTAKGIMKMEEPTIKEGATVITEHNR